MRSTMFAAAACAALFLSGTLSAGAASLVAEVDIPTQTMKVLRYGKVIHTWKVSTARSGYKTPTGSWRPYRMHRMWHSRKYDMAPMPFAVFYDGGYAVHGTSAVRRLGSPASHGCVRLDTPNAAIFYALVQEMGPGNTRVIVSDGSIPATADVAAPLPPTSASNTGSILSIQNPS
jgi:lipoprotein-anchoring transpeptidase ErfK/SrfK